MKKIAVVLLILACEAAAAWAQSDATAGPRWVSTDGPIGGLGYDVRYNFGDRRIWYVTDSFAGLHMSYDGGATWTRSAEGITTRIGMAGDFIPIFCLTVDPNDPHIVWIGTQESGDIYRSTDGGKTWTKKINGIDRTHAAWLSFRGLTIEPGNSNVVYAMAEVASPGFTPGGAKRICVGPDSTKGVVYKTTDGGENWTLIWSGNNLARYCFIDPRNHDVLYVSTGIFDREAADCNLATNSPGGVGILKSTDGGKSWRVLNGANGLTDLFVGSLYLNPVYPDVLLAAASNPDWSGRSGTHTGGVFLSENGGETWTKVLSGGENYATVEFCPSHPEIAYAASPRAIYRSDDRGRTWERFARADGTWGPDGVIAGFPIDMQCDPVDPDRLFVNNYLGGNFLSHDKGKTWAIASQGYTGAQMAFVTVSPGDSRRVFAGSRTGVFRNDSAGMGEWTGLGTTLNRNGVIVQFNELTSMAVDPADEDHLMASPTDLGGVASSRDGGKTWTIADVRIQNGVVRSLIFSPAAPSRAWFGVAGKPCEISSSACDGESLGLWTSSDGGASWSEITVSEVVDRSIYDITPHPTSADTVYVATAAHGIWRSTDAGATWSNRSSGIPPTAVVMVVAIDPSAPETLFAGLYQGGVYRSTDGGTSWSHASLGMDPEAVIGDIAIDPITPGVVYAAEKTRGVYRSTDGGASWSLFNDGLVPREVRALAIARDGSRMYAATNGGGVSRIDLNVVPRRRTVVR